MVIVINGPIASGKSAVARATAAELDRRGTSAAVIDVDVLYAMLDQRTGVPEADDAAWLLARVAAGSLVDTFLAGGINAVLVEGRFFAEERRQFLSALRAPVSPHFVTLRVSYDEALRRTQSDGSRGVSRDPAFLGPYFARTERDLSSLPPGDLVIDTERESVETCVAKIINHASSN